MHLRLPMALAAVRSKVVVLLLLVYCFMYHHCLGGLCVGLCFGMNYFMSVLVVQSSGRGRESWLLCFYCLSYV